MKAALYLRVSTAEQTVVNQEAELLLACARHDWEVVKVFRDAGISGAKGRDKRPAFDALCKAIARREFDLVAAWSVDRLGRSLIDLIGFLSDIHEGGARSRGRCTGFPGGWDRHSTNGQNGWRWRLHCHADQGRVTGLKVSEGWPLGWSFDQRGKSKGHQPRTCL